MPKPKRAKKRKAIVPTEEWQRMRFEIMLEAYRAGQAAGQFALDHSPDCHETCTTNSMLSYYLGSLIPHVRDEAEIRRLAVLVVPRIVEAMALIAGAESISVTASAPSLNPRLN